MAGRSGFITNHQTMMYLESPDLPSAAVGLDSTDNYKLKIRASQTDTAFDFSVGNTQLTIDSTANGNITLTPNGNGTVVVSSLGIGAVISSATGLLSSSGSGVAGQVLMSNGSGVAPTFQNSEDVSWSDIAGNTVALVPNKGYMLNNVGLTTATLPAICPAGDIIRICGSGAGLFQINLHLGQEIHLGSVSASGVFGLVASSQQFDAIELLCVVANTVFATISSVGNFTVS